MRKGDLVKIRDSSYSTIINNGKLKNGYGDVTSRQCVVVEVDCNFPRTAPGYSTIECNNTVIQDCKTGEIIFIVEHFLDLVAHTLIIDGKTIELSHESFLNLREQLV